MKPCIIRPSGFDFGRLTGLRSGLALSKARRAASKPAATYPLSRPAQMSESAAFTNNAG
jgi:hypothetical protein